MNIGIVQMAQSNPANETTNFLNNLKEAVAVDQKSPSVPHLEQRKKEPKHKFQVKPSIGNKAMQATTPTLQLN